MTTLGEKLTDDEVGWGLPVLKQGLIYLVLQVGELLQGQEDSQGNVNYEEFVKLVMSG